MSQDPRYRFRTRAIHVASPRDPASGAVVPPVHLATTFVQPGSGQWSEFDYSRSGNPTRQQLERVLATLDGGAHALAFASGMAAIHAATLLLRPGDHVVAGRDIYGGAYRLFHKVLQPAGVEVTLADATQPDQVEKACRPSTRLIWIESPGNPLMSIVDIQACSEIARRHDALLGVDNTFATPVLTRPLELGADIVMYSATKYHGGHSDALGGALVVASQDLYDRLYFLQNATGAVLAPWDCFLIARGVKTLALRVAEQSRTAQRIAEHLVQHPRVRRVLYPGLADHPGHALAARQMQGGFGAMLSFEMDGGVDQTRRVVESTRLFQLAVSLGAVESLIEQPALMSHASYDPEDRARYGISDGLIRLSVGLEDPNDLIEDLDQAIATA